MSWITSRVAEFASLPRKTCRKTRNLAPNIYFQRNNLCKPNSITRKLLKTRFSTGFNRSKWVYKKLKTLRLSWSKQFDLGTTLRPDIYKTIVNFIQNAGAHRNFTRKCIKSRSALQTVKNLTHIICNTERD